MNMEQFLQETVFQTNKSRHTNHIVAQIVEIGGSPQYFLAEVVSLTPVSRPFSIVHCLPRRYAIASEAFKGAFDRVRFYASTNNETITSIDNPCNCPFISKDEQQSIVAATGITVQINENGQ
jgi:hypothetical protein